MPRKPKNYSSNRLIREFQRVERKLGHQPNSSDMIKCSKIGFYHYMHKYGSWKNFLHSIGLKTNWNPPSKPEDLIKAFWQLHRKLRRQPTSHEIYLFGKYRIHYYIKEFGSWQAFLKSQHIHYEKKRSVTQKELLDAFQTLQKKLGHPPSSLEMVKHGKFTPHFYRREFGSWQNFLDQIN
jgi:hypothetical protein